MYYIRSTFTFDHIKFEAVNLMSQGLSGQYFTFHFISPHPLYGIQFLVSIVRKDMMMMTFI